MNVPAAAPAVQPLASAQPLAGRPLHILWVLPYLPWPTTSGGKLRQYHLLRTLAERGHRITLLVQSKEEASDECTRRLAALVERVVVLPRRPRRHPKTLLAALFAPYPLLVSVNGLAADFRRTFARLLDDERWDVVQIEHSYTLQSLLPELRRRRRAFLLTEHNVESALGAATYRHLPRWFTPFIAYDQWRYRHWERLVMRAATRVAAVTAEDAQHLARVRGSAVDVVINGVDCRAFAAVQADAGSHRLVFVGNFEYPPNRDAVLWCLEEIMPQVWQRMPQARLAICGFAMPAAWRTRWTDARIEWRGFVPDLPAELATAAVFLAPLRVGGGSKLKVLEALAAGLPVVTTPQGMSGLALVPGRDLAVAETPSGLAERAVTLLAEPEAARAMAAAGRRYVDGFHDWSVAADQLERIYREMLDARRP